MTGTFASNRPSGPVSGNSRVAGPVGHRIGLVERHASQRFSVSIQEPAGQGPGGEHPDGHEAGEGRGDALGGDLAGVGGVPVGDVAGVLDRDPGVDDPAGGGVGQVLLGHGHDEPAVEVGPGLPLFEPGVGRLARVVDGLLGVELDLGPGDGQAGRGVDDPAGDRAFRLGGGVGLGNWSAGGVEDRDRHRVAEHGVEVALAGLEGQVDCPLLVARGEPKLLGDDALVPIGGGLDLGEPAGQEAVVEPEDARLDLLEVGGGRGRDPPSLVREAGPRR